MLAATGYARRHWFKHGKESGEEQTHMRVVEHNEKDNSFLTTHKVRFSSMIIFGNTRPLVSPYRTGERNLDGNWRP